jgi:para-nitrobenzyl esterase
MLNKTVTQEIGAEVLKQLGLDASQIDSLQKVPYAQLNDAGNRALKVVNDKYAKSGGTALNAGWGPSLDGTDIPYQVFSKEAYELSKDIPLMIGTVKNEFMPSLFTNMSNAPMDKVMEYIKNTQKDKADAFVAAVKKAYPDDKKPSDLMDVDVRFRPGAVKQAKEKSALNAAPVYMYLFTWQSPIMDGKYKAFHCMELPFVFNNIARCEEMTGGAKDAYALAAKMSDAWINFARTGNPNHKGLPTWPKFDQAKTATMHFNTTCVVKPQMDKELFDLLGL